jgi:glycosyltransferase involved in cell wall biosynthesis
VKILLSAYCCLPDEGSENAVGWNWAQCIGHRGHQVLVITRTVNRRKIESHIGLHPTRQVRYVYHDLPVARLLYGIPFGNYLYYIIWQWTAASLACRLHRTEHFELVQHITWASFRAPSFMGRLRIPFIFGPVGGGEDTPRNLRGGMGLRGRFLDAVRRMSNRLVKLGMSYTYSSADRILATTEETRASIPAIYRRKSLVRQAVGVELPVLEGHACDETDDGADRRLKVVFAGRLMAWKGVHLLLRALERVRLGDTAVHLTVIGSGPDGKRLHKLSDRLGTGSKIAWVPWLERHKLLSTYRDFDLFAFPSLHDSGGLAVLEALSYGLPVLCLDVGGPAAVVDESCGCVIRTADASENDVVDAIARQFERIAAHRERLQELSHGAIARAARRGWQKVVDEVYDSPELPVFVETCANPKLRSA